MNAFTRTMVAVATNVLPKLCFIPGAHTMYPFRSKLAVLVAVVSIVLLANSSPVSAQTYDWTNLSDEQLTNFSAGGAFCCGWSRSALFIFVPPRQGNQRPKHQPYAGNDHGA